MSQTATVFLVIALVVVLLLLIASVRVVWQALGDASDTMMMHPLALQLRNLQTLAELGVEKNTTVVFPAPLMSAIGELTGFLTRESAATADQHIGLAHEALTHAAQH